MFENILKKNLDINFKKETNFYTFEIPDFLSDEQYDLLDQNFPRLGIDEGSKINPSFYDTSKQHQLKTWISVLHPEVYSKHVLSNRILNEFVNAIKSEQFTDFLLKNLYYKIIKSRIYDPKNLLKLLLRKNRAYTIRSNTIEKFIFNEIFTTVEWIYNYNGAESYPHTDGKKKILSLLLYFPDKELSDNQVNNLGTTFFNSSEHDLASRKITNKNQADDFRKRYSSFTLPFKKKSLFGFIKSHKSWHSVEPIDIDKNFIRKSININLLLT